MTKQDEITVRKATPAETAAYLVKKYDDIIQAYTPPQPAAHVPFELAEVLRIAARLADFVAIQYNID